MYLQVLVIDCGLFWMTLRVTASMCLLASLYTEYGQSRDAVAAFFSEIFFRVVASFQRDDATASKRQKTTCSRTASVITQFTNTD